MTDKSDEYLWDKSGPPDPEVVRLEELLRPLGQQESTVRLKPDTTYTTAVRLKADTTSIPSASTSTGKPKGLRHFSRPERVRYVPALAAAALIAIAIGGWWLVNRPRPAATAWTVTSVEGSPTIASRRIDRQTALPVGAWLETNGQSKASISVASVGRVEIEPGTRVGLVSARPGDHRLQLTRGTLHAVIWAPPGQFFVETPSSLAVDLGCAYTLTVDEAGNGLVHVTAGWVGFEWQGRESFIPAGSLCVTRRIGRDPVPPALITRRPRGARHDRFQQLVTRVEIARHDRCQQLVTRVERGARCRAGGSRRARRGHALAPAGARACRPAGPRIRSSGAVCAATRRRHP